MSKTHKYKVSVIVPCYNVSEFISDAFLRLDNQTLDCVEYVYVDDGSTDGTLQILESLAESKNNVKVLSQKNSGAGAARNTGLKNSNGEFLIFLDADDIYAEDLLEKLYCKAVLYGADISECQMNFYDDMSGIISNFIDFSDHKGNCYRPSEFCENILQVLKWNPQNKLFNSDFVSREGLLFQETPNTNDLLFVAGGLLTANKIALIHEPLASYRVNTGSSIQDGLVKSVDINKCLSPLSAIKALRERVEGKSEITESMMVSLNKASVFLALYSIELASRDMNCLDIVLKNVKEEVATWLSNKVFSLGHSRSSKFLLALILQLNTRQFQFIYEKRNLARNKNSFLRDPSAICRAILTLFGFKASK